MTEDLEDIALRMLMRDHYVSMAEAERILDELSPRELLSLISFALGELFMRRERNNG